MMHRSGHADAARATRVRIVAGRAIRLGLGVLLLPAASSAQVERQSQSLDNSRRTALVTAAERASPAVVSITVTSRQRISPRTPWELLFVPRGASRPVSGSAIFTSTCGSARPTVETRRSRLSCVRVMVITGEVSVRP